MAGGPVPLVGGQVPYSQLFVPNGMQAIPFLPVGGQVTNSGYVFGASMSPGMSSMCPGGFPIPMSPAFGGACGGEVAGSDPVVIEVEPGSACAGIRQEPPATVEEINVDEAPGRRDEAVKTPRKRQAETEVFIGTPERCPTSRVRQMNNPADASVRPSLPVGSPLMNAPWLSTQGGTTSGVTPEAWQRMQQQAMQHQRPQQPVRPPQPDPLMTFLAQQSQQNAFMMQQMMQMTAAVVQALNGLSSGVPPRRGDGRPWWSGWWRSTWWGRSWWWVPSIEPIRSACAFRVVWTDVDSRGLRSGKRIGFSPRGS